MKSTPLLIGLIAVSLFALAESPTSTPNPSASPSANPNPDLPFYTKLQLAAQELQKENYPKALSLIEEAEKLKPNTIEASTIKASTYLYQKEYAKAHEIFLKNATLLPDDVGAQYNLAESEFVAGTFPGAREKLTKLLERVKATPKEKLNTLPFGDATEDFFKYKIYLSYIFENKLDEGKKMLDQFDPYAITPLYYFGCAAMEFNNKNNMKGLEWIGSATKIYNLTLIQLFSNSFFDKGWIRKGTKPGDIVTDLNPQNKK